jgi:hypothetical protein
MVLNALKKLLVSAPASNNAQTQALQAGILVISPSIFAMVSEFVPVCICLGYLCLSYFMDFDLWPRGMRDMVTGLERVSQLIVLPEDKGPYDMLCIFCTRVSAQLRHLLGLQLVCC